MEEALNLHKLPRTVGSHKNSDVIVNIGRFGPYIHYEDKYYSVPKNENLLDISLDRCLEIIAAKKETDKAKAPRLVGKYNEMEVSVAVGKYGPYILYNKQFYKLPAGTEIQKITLKEAINIITEIDDKNTIKRFTEDKDLKIIKVKKVFYIAKGENKYSIPKGKLAEDLTYNEIIQLIKDNLAKTKNK
ncbi:MAG: topoisomerase C-terminal repeat-containing protein [Bacteroidales bacterium]|nr:topoisomerase C-terminal repeat-containing protein [Bacteroidales bacterium]